MKRKIRIEPFRIDQPRRFRIKDAPTDIAPLYDSKEEYEELLQERIAELARRQNLLYAHNHYAILLIFQAMDAAGKDSAIQHVMSGINPQGCQVFSFKQPSAEELDHDFLWRAIVRLPERGRFGVFNRSYYEEVLVVRVHPEFLEKQGLPDELVKGKKLWAGRYRSIVDFEKHLHRNGTRVIKFYLHLSKEEQAKRFVKRIDNPEKNWKFSLADLAERKLWSNYMAAYQECIRETSTPDAPWYVVPADDKKNARLLISEIILRTLRALPMSYPEVSAAQRQELKKIRKELAR